MAKCILIILISFQLVLISQGRKKHNETKLNGNCSQSSIEHFPHLPLPGGVIISTTITLLSVSYLFLFLVKVCDYYFVATIKVIGRNIGLSSDVAGATLMAAAVSSPDLFMNIIGTFVTEGDIGIGTVVGCGLFNTLAVPALCILLSYEKMIKLNGWSLTRDSVFYCGSLIILSLSLADNIIDWHEGLLLVSIYFVYILFLSQNTTLRTKTEEIINRWRSKNEKNVKTPLLLKSHSILSYGGDDEFYRDILQDEEIPWWKVLSKIVTFPIDIILKTTVPNPQDDFRGYKLYPVTFVICLIWIGIVSYIVAWMITIAGFELKIPDSFVGLTFIAIGMSVPEAASSVIVAKRGDGAMALSNSMGSSVFDTLFGLGFPWLLKTAINNNHNVLIASKGMAYTSLLLIISIIIMYTSIAINKFRLNKTVGFICLIVYIVLAILSAMIEMNIFFEGNLPLCN